MRHPPRSLLLAVAGAFALVGAMTLPVVTAQGAQPACLVEYSVASQWDNGFQCAVKSTNGPAALSSWVLTFNFAGGQKVTQGWNAKWSKSGTTVTAGNESWNGSLDSGVSVSAGFVGSWSGSNAAGTAPALHVSGSKLVGADGTTRRLLGVNRSGGEFMCIQGRGMWDGPMGDAAINAIADWKADAIRIPLNEECWLGLSTIKPEDGGANYINAVKDVVARAEAHGLTPILDLHWTSGHTGNSAGCSDMHAGYQKPMPSFAS